MVRSNSRSSIHQYTDFKRKYTHFCAARFSQQNNLINQQNYMEELELSVERFTQQQFAIDAWEILDVNVCKLEENCYYATAAGLCGLTTAELANITETMQNIGGTVDDTRDLIWEAIHVNTISLEFENYDLLLQYFDRSLKLGSVERYGFAYCYPVNSQSGIDGHMIALKVWKSVSNEIFIRCIDFQLNPIQRCYDCKNFRDIIQPQLGPVYLIVLDSVVSQ